MDWPGAAEWLGLFSEYLIKTTLVLSLCLLVVSASRGRAAAIRHFLLSFFLIGMLLLPVFSIFRIGWETSLLPARATGVEVRGATIHPRPFETGSLPARLPALAPEASRMESSGSDGVIAVSVHGSSPASGLGWFLGASLPYFWSAGLALLLLKLCLGILGAHRLTREGIDVSDPVWRIVLARFLAAIRIRRTVRLKSHAGIGVPITWGLLRPVILIPRGHEDWTEDQRSSALLHELGHVKRADFLVLSLVRLSLAVFWFNPLCWIVFRQIKQEQERACDELVLTAGIKPSTYAATLLFFKRTAGFRHNVSAVFLGLFDSASFNERLAAILRQKLTLKEVTMKTKLTLAIAVILAVSLIGLARPSAALPERPLNSIILVSAAPRTAVPPAWASAIAGGDSDRDKKVEALKEQDKKAEEQKRTIVIINKEGEKLPIEIIAAQGDVTRKIKVEKALSLKKGKDGELILVGAGGKELEVLKGKPIRLTVAGKDLTLVQEGGVFKIEKGDLLKLTAGKDKEGVEVRVAPRRQVRIVDKSGAERLAVYVQKGTDEKPVFYWLGLEKVAEQVKEKLEELREKLSQTKEKQVEIAQVKQAIEKIKAELQPQVIVREKPMTITLVKPKGADVTGSGIYVMKDAGKGVMTVWMGGGAGFSVIFGISAGENNRQVYERVVARVRRELPEGYVVDPEFNEKSGGVTLKISGPETQKVSIELIKKVTEVIRAEIKSPE